MSYKLLDYVKKFSAYEIPFSLFCEDYQDLWKKERDSGLLSKDDESLSFLLSSVFCNVDLVNTDDEPLEYEIDEAVLRKRIDYLLSSLQQGEDMDIATTNVVFIK